MAYYCPYISGPKDRKITFDEFKTQLSLLKETDANSRAIFDAWNLVKETDGTDVLDISDLVQLVLAMDKQNICRFPAYEGNVFD